MVLGRNEKELVVNGEIKKRRKKEESTVVELTLLKLEGEKPSYKFQLSKAAYDLLLSVDSVKEKNQIFIACNVMNNKEWFFSTHDHYTSNDRAVVLNKNMSFTNKKAFLNLVKAYSLDTSIDNKFTLTIDSDDPRLLQLKTIETVEEISNNE